MRVAVVGGSGFIGTRLVVLLVEAGHEVIIGDQVQSERFPDLVRLLSLDSVPDLAECFRGCDVVINLAAAHRDDIQPVSVYYDVNVEGARRVCEAAALAGVPRILFTSSVAIYGTTVDDEIYDESRTPAPFNDYGRSKLEAEEVYRSWQNEKPDRSLTIIRPTVVFGEGNRGNVYNLIKQVAEKKFLMIGNGRNLKSIAYVGNVAAFLVHCLESSERYSIFNYVDGPDLSVADLVALIKRSLGRRETSGISIPYWLGWVGGGALDLVAAATGLRFPISRVRVMKFCANTRFSARSVESAGFKAPLGVRDAIERTVRHEFGQSGN
jgi:nucleoside-diphosphate-sugar epimerase